MRTTITTLILLLLTLTAPGADTETLRIKADRYYHYREWPSALAMMQLILDTNPDDTPLRARAIAAATMAADTLSLNTLGQTMIDRHLPFPPLYDSLLRESLALGHSEIYPGYLERIARTYPWLKRSTDSYLLQFYLLRNYPPGIIEYARRMLNGLPDDPRFLHALARGQMLAADYTAACQTYRRLLQINPDDLEALLQLGSYLMETHRTAEAMPLLRHACSLAPTPYLEKICRQNP